jgi:hypothetical protein
MSNPTLQFPAPPTNNLIRQIAIGVAGSPIALSRGSSTGSGSSDILPPDESIRHRLLVYRTHLEHEIEFVDREILALIQRPPSQDAAQDAALLDLRNGLKIRYNNLCLKLTRVGDLLSVL